MTTRAALTTIEIIEEEDLVENAARVGAAALARLHEHEVAHALHRRRARARLPDRHRARARPRLSKAPDHGRGRSRRCMRALDRGLSFKTTMGNVLTLTPPLTVTEAEMMQALDILDEAIGSVAAK